MSEIKPITPVDGRWQNVDKEYLPCLVPVVERN